jgi:hypothetical protein
MYSWLCLALLVFAPLAIVAQPVLHNAGEQLFFIGAGETVFVAEPTVLTTQDGFINNQGTLRMTGDWENNNPANTGFLLPSVNGTVELAGNAQQIRGTQETVFNNLVLENLVVKRVLTSASTDAVNVLNIGQSELRTDDFVNFTVQSPDPAAITRTTGFVSNGYAGRLIRQTDRLAVYSFPVGDSLLGPFRFRPVDVTPSADPQQFEVRFANISPSLSPPPIDGTFPRTSLSDLLCEVNEYFHMVNQAGSTDPAQLSFYFDPSEPISDTLAGWEEGAALWQPVGPTNVVRGGSLLTSNMTVAGWNDYTPGAFAFATLRPAAGFTTSALPFVEGIPIQFTANAQSPNFIYDWDFGDGVGTSTQANPTYTYGFRGQYTVRYRVTDRNNRDACTEEFEITALVQPRKSVYYPSAFTPNGPGQGSNGTNDQYLVYFYGYDEVKFRVYNRWGELVYEVNSDPGANSVSWDGFTQAGDVVQEGVYVFVLDLRPEGGGRMEQRSGSITVLR